MAAQPRLVNKQFNTPINLYSKQNVQEVLERETQILSNGAVGINFYNPGAGKPGNLANSAVLRMLEEEENRQRNGHPPSNGIISRPLREQITWPPPEYEHRNVHRATFKDVVTPGAKRVAWPPPREGEEGEIDQAAIQSQGGPQISSQTSPGLQNNHVVQPTPQPVSRSPLKPLDISSASQSHPNYHQSPVSPLLNQSPAGFRPQTPSKQWAPVHSPASSHSPQPFQPQPQYQPVLQQYQPPQQQYQPPQPQYQPPQQQYQPPQQQYQPPQQQYQPPQQQYQPPQQQYQPPNNYYVPQYQQNPQEYQPVLGQQYQPHYQPPQQFQPPQQQQYQPPPPQQYQAPPQQQYQASPQQYQPPVQQYQSPQTNQSSQPLSTSQPQPANQQQVAPAQVAQPVHLKPQPPKQVQPPPSTITLRPQAPVSQAPPPVVNSQPATATFKGGKNLRGDMKWPPEEVKSKMEEENRQRLELAKGPVCRPRRVHKDYTGFFAQHALNSTYPGYKIPPGTQFFRT